MQNVLKAIGDFGIIPIVVIDNADDAIPLCNALKAGGLPVAEVTFRTAAAEDALKRISAEVPDMLLGAGTVLNTDQAERAINAGAKFIVSPGIDPEVVKYALKRGIAIAPGVCSPTDITTAVSLGLDVVKFFPSEAFGGIKTLKAVAAPFGMVKFIPTGGVEASNLNEYLSFNKVLACGGSWMVKADLIKAGKFDEITRLTREAVTTMLGFDLAHVGFNTDGDGACVELANKLGAIFNMPVKNGDKSYWTGSAFEIMKGKGRGVNGHLAIRTHNLQRAIAYLERNGTTIDHESAYRPNGKDVSSIFLKEELGGFAVHLLQAN